jgi:hypothetical protein
MSRDSSDEDGQLGRGEKPEAASDDEAIIKQLVKSLNEMRIRNDSTNVVVTSSDGRQFSAHSLVLESTSELFAELIRVGIFKNGFYSY